MGFFDSKSEQSSASSQAGAQTQTGDSTSLSVSGGKYTIVNNSIQKLDNGAINSAFDFARDMASGYGELSQDAVNSISSISSKAIEISANSIDDVAEAARSETAKLSDNLAKYGIVAGTVVALAFFYWK